MVLMMLMLMLLVMVIHALLGVCIRIFGGAAARLRRVGALMGEPKDVHKGTGASGTRARSRKLLGTAAGRGVRGMGRARAGTRCRRRGGGRCGRMGTCMGEKRAGGGGGEHGRTGKGRRAVGGIVGVSGRHGSRGADGNGWVVTDEGGGYKGGLFLRVGACAGGGGAAGARRKMDAVAGRGLGADRKGLLNVLTAAGGCPGGSSVSRSQERDTCGCARRCGRECVGRGGQRW